MGKRLEFVVGLVGALGCLGCGDESSKGGSCTPNPVGGGLQSGASWATYRRDAGHSGAAIVPGPAAPEVAWTFAPGGVGLDGYWPPSVAADGTLYVAVIGMAYAISSEGELVWSLRLPGRPYGSPSIGGDRTIYFSMNELHAVSPEGKLLWSFKPPADEIAGTAAIGSDGSVYIAAESVGLYALGSEGCIRWSFEKNGTEEDPSTSPAIGADGTLYFGMDRSIVAASPDGRERWRHPLGDVQHLSPVVGPDGTIYAISDGITALTAQGVVKWSVPGAGSGTQFPPSVSGDSQLYVPSSHALRAFDAAGTELWSVASQSFPTPVIDSNGVAYIADSSCLASAISKNGQTLWSESFSANGCGSPILSANGTLYYSSLNEGIIAVRDR